MLKLSVMGQRKLLYPFMDHFKSQPYYEIKSDCTKAVVETTSGLEEVCTFFEFHGEEQQWAERPTMWVNMKAKNGKEIRLNLLDGSLFDLGDGSVVVYGKHYDIFSCKKPSTDK